MILLVEDDKWLADTYIHALHQVGYACMHAPDAEQAIMLVDKHMPAAIILDILLTGTTAYALLNELQSYVDTAAIPVIVCSGLADIVRAEDLAEYGVSRVLDKATMRSEDLPAAIKMAGVEPA